MSSQHHPLLLGVGDLVKVMIVVRQGQHGDLKPEESQLERLQQVLSDQVLLVATLADILLAQLFQFNVNSTSYGGLAPQIHKRGQLTVLSV